MPITGTGRRGAPGAATSARPRETNAPARTAAPANTRAPRETAGQPQSPNRVDRFFRDLFEQPRAPTSKPAPRATAGVDRNGAFANAGLVTGRDPKTGFEADLFAGGGRVGLQNEIQAGMARVGISSEDGAKSLHGEIFTARGNIGIRNSDGSTGLNAGATATLVGAEATYGQGGNSLTVGAGIGFGAEGSAGIRDVDQDGRIEKCARGSFGVLTLGGCVEDAFKSYNPGSSGVP